MTNKLVLFGAASLTGLAAVQAQEKPNIIYIMCDDMGYGDLGCYGQQYIATPNLDRMAAQGMRFTQAYAGSPVSAPSRASFMTGQHTGHTHVRGNKEYWPSGGRIQYGNHSDYARVGQEPYDPNHKIIPEIMKEHGYTTGMFGKWAGGYEGSASTPDKRGIDQFYGYICQFQAHLYYPNFMNRYDPSRGDEGVVRVLLEENIPHPMYGNGYENRPQYTADLIHQEALAWLDKQTADKPFLGIFTYTLPHAELIQPEDSILLAYKGHFCKEKTFGGDAGSWYNPTDIAHAQFAGMITRLDKQVGEILDKLEEKGMTENTIVIFTSDNGPHEEGGADPSFFNRDGLLRGTKRSTHEGGIRVPFIVRWPGTVEAGRVSDHQLAFYDILPTFCDIASISGYPEAFVNKKLKGDCFDGLSFYNELTGKPQETHDFLYWEFHETNMMALRMGNWKMVVKNGNCMLYDLVNDIHEDTDVAAKYPEVVQKMKEIIHAQHTNSDLFKVTLPTL
jgi:arylsulfatase A-like enzyme